MNNSSNFTLVNILWRDVRFFVRAVRNLCCHTWHEELVGVRSILRLCEIDGRAKSVLIVEPNSYHGETIPGYCKYFLDLGYTVFGLLRQKNFSGGLFVRYPKTIMPQIFCLGPWGMKMFLRSKKVKQFDVVLFNSNFYYARDVYWGLYKDYIQIQPNSKYGCLYVEHCFQNLLPHVQERTVDLGRIFQLCEYRHGDISIPMVNPHYFGPYVVRALADVKVFITVGAVNPQNRNVPQLVAVVQSLVRRGIFNFRILLIGKIDPTVNVVGIPSQIVFLGPLDFPAMYQKMEEANYFLPLLDPSNESHRRYLGGQTTGSRQLILGFAKIPVLHEEFARAYDFSEKNAILHTDGGLEAAMERAITMTQPEYDAMRHSLEELARTVYSTSLDNLRKTLDVITTGKAQ